MRKMFWCLFSCLAGSYCVQAQVPSPNTYAYPTLSSLDDISSYLSNMPSSPLPLSSSPAKSDLPATGFFVTVYETSPGLKDLLYVTTYFQFQEGGKTEISDVAGPVGSKLTTRKGQATFLSQDKHFMVFLHKDGGFTQEFINVLQIFPGETGELLTIQGHEYLKGYVHMERKQSNVVSRTN